MNIILWKESLNGFWLPFGIFKLFLNSSDGNQFHQYQQNEQSSLILTEQNKKNRPRHMTFEIQVLV